MSGDFCRGNAIAERRDAMLVASATYLWWGGGRKKTRKLTRDGEGFFRKVLGGGDVGAWGRDLGLWRVTNVIQKNMDRCETRGLLVLLDRLSIVFLL